jgi:diguanylate cyclase (GGDEF)-like protein/PAS domain S-box-containing protein
MDQKRENRERFGGAKLAAFIAFVYLLIVSFWFLYADRLLMSMLNNIVDVQVIYILRYWSVVVLTAVLLFLLIHFQIASKRSVKALEDIKFALDQSSIVAITDRVGMIQYVNDKFCEVTKYSNEEIVGNTHRLINSGYHPKEFFTELWKTISNGKVWKGEVKNKAKDGVEFWVDTTIVPFLNRQGQPYQYIVIRTDITEQKLIEQKVQQIAYYDALTQLPNRLLLLKELSSAIEQCEQRNEWLAVLLFDIDRFKMMNDLYGHSFGDKLLKAVAERIRHCLREKDGLYRVGADEFAVTLYNATPQWVSKFVEIIQEAFSETFLIDHQELFVTLSAGISFYPFGKDINTLIQNADLAVYFAKEEGGNIYHFFTPEMNEKVSQKMQMDAHLRRAVEQDEFVAYFQPFVDMNCGKLIGMEALIRWDHPEWGIVLPGQFIPLAEETGLIVPIGEKMLRLACIHTKKWVDEGFSQLRVAVNLSAQQFQQWDFVQKIDAILKETGLPPACLELEITEGVAMQNSDKVISTLSQLVQLGVHISIDDFGTGYSSLSYLKKFPIQSLKIDQSFIQAMMANPGDLAITKAIIQLSKSLALKVIAEGIETEEQFQLLKQNGCDVAQGYLFGKPMSPMDFENFLNGDCAYSI